LWIFFISGPFTRKRRRWWHIVWSHATVRMIVSVVGYVVCCLKCKSYPLRTCLMPPQIFIYDLISFQNILFPTNFIREVLCILALCWLVRKRKQMNPNKITLKKHVILGAITYTSQRT
jgi:hypothetical protein